MLNMLKGRRKKKSKKINIFTKKKQEKLNIFWHFFWGKNFKISISIERVEVGAFELDIQKDT